MAYLKKTVSVNGTEVDFIKELVSTLTSIDERITCNDDIDSAFSDTSATPKININLGNYCMLTLTRGTTLSSSTSYYTVTCSDKTNTYRSGDTYVYFISSGENFSVQAIRECNILVVTSSNSMVIAIENYNISTPSSFTNKFIILIADEFSAIPNASYSATNSYNPSYAYINNFTFYRTDPNGLGESFKFRNCFVFEMNGESLKQIDKKIMTPATSTAQYYGEYAGLYDTSYTAPNLILTINGEKYYTVDKCTMIKIKE